MGRRYLGGDEIAAFCYQAGEVLDLRLPQQEGEEKGRLIPIEWATVNADSGERGFWNGFAPSHKDVVCLQAERFLLLAASGSEVRPWAASTYVHECAHKLHQWAEKRLNIPTERSLWRITGHDYVFSAICWALFLRLQLPE